MTRSSQTHLNDPDWDDEQTGLDEHASDDAVVSISTLDGGERYRCTTCGSEGPERDTVNHRDGCPEVDSDA